MLLIGNYNNQRLKYSPSSWSKNVNHAQLVTNTSKTYLK